MSDDITNSLNTTIIQAMDERGITLDRLIKQLADELEAYETKIFTYRGKIIEERQVIAWDVRQRARMDAHKLRGDYPAQGLNVQATGNHTVIIRRFEDEPKSTE